MEDFKALERDDKVTKRIIRCALEDHLQRPDCSLAACPSPDCEGVFRGLQPGQEGDNSEPFFCVSCGVDICRRYNCPFLLATFSQPTSSVAALSTTTG